MKLNTRCIFFLSLSAAILITGCQSSDTAPPDSFTNSIGMKFVLIQPGTFMMGSPLDEPLRKPDEKQHKVTISKPFYLQTTEVTQELWKMIMGHNPAVFKTCGTDCPVSMVSWNEAQEFIKRINEKEKTDKYRLPTEAEWEYACRAGTTTVYYTGNCITTDQANYHGKHPLPGCPEGPNRETPLAVGSFPPNAWGLYDMHGNLWEWCQDWYGDYPSSHVTDPTGPSSGDGRVVRGGSWNHFGANMRSAYRGAEVPDGQHCITVRVACDVGKVN
ncbi:MAG: formylglycine-generating enzyme family protein [Deltaproteobacteria bacterium]|nr:formylglycine-generating enzyme family protein [Deltaproteobacteria bacterium]